MPDGPDNPTLVAENRRGPRSWQASQLALVSVDASPELLAGLLPDQWAVAHPEQVLNHGLESRGAKPGAGTSAARAGTVRRDALQGHATRMIA
jgi:hypothetical protein